MSFCHSKMSPFILLRGSILICHLSERHNRKPHSKKNVSSTSFSKMHSVHIIPTIGYSVPWLDKRFPYQRCNDCQISFTVFLFYILDRPSLTLKVMTSKKALWLTLCMFSEVTVLEVLGLVKKTHTPVSATSFPSVTNTLDFLLRPGCWATSCEGAEAAEAAAAEAKMDIEWTQGIITTNLNLIMGNLHLNQIIIALIKLLWLMSPTSLFTKVQNLNVMCYQQLDVVDI